MKQISHLVIYKDSATDRALFFGPFVSQSIAQFFKAEMPQPLEGGYCRIVPTQPFTQQEGHVVFEKLTQARCVTA